MPMTSPNTVVESAGLETLGGAAYEPWNVAVMDVDAFIQRNSLQQVTSLAVHAPSSIEFHPSGLFSEPIFGEIGSTTRLTRHGWIELNATLLSPIVFKNILKLGDLYGEIMAGRSYARYDPITKNFERVYGDPEKTPDADTGYSFFMEHYPEMVFSRSDSMQRDNRIKLVTMYRDRAMIRRMLVHPAGLRDVELAEAQITQDEINKLYIKLLALSFAIPAGARSRHYDGVRYELQMILVAIYDHFENLMTGKSGFLQGAHGARRLIGGTRNVITAASYDALTPDHPRALKSDETMVGLFQTMKAFEPLVVHHMKTTFLNPIFGIDVASSVAVINPKTYALEYREFGPDALNTFVGPQAINAMISRFRNSDVRAKPVAIRDVTKRTYYLCLVYQMGDEIVLFRNLDDLKSLLDQPIDLKNVRPLTWIELFYLVTMAAVAGRHVTVTRYPVIEAGSCYPSKIHVATTEPSRTVTLRDLISGHLAMSYPEYPIIGGAYCDSVVVSTDRIAGLGADYDGDTVSINPVYTDEGNAEIANYLESPKRFLNTKLGFASAGNNHLISLMFHNFSWVPKDVLSQ